MKGENIKNQSIKRIFYDFLFQAVSNHFVCPSFKV